MNQPRIGGARPDYGIHRWTAQVTYRSEKGPLIVEHDFQELEELHDLVERGPSFETIERIEITYNRSCRTLTIEAAEKE